MRSRVLGAEFWARWPLVGMVHLPALPGSPAYMGGGIEPVLARAAADARALEEGGADAVMVENFFDTPFPKDSSPPHTVAAMALAVQAVREAVRLPVGVNVLRNDARGALAVAAVTGLQFVRVNVYVGASVTDQGVIEGAAREAILYRRELGAAVEIWADVMVKHAVPLGDPTLEDLAKDAVLRGQADALIVSGAATGAATEPGRARRVRDVVPGTPVLVGSGFDPASAASLVGCADGAIVGTSLKRDGLVANPVDPQRVRALRAAVDRHRSP